MAQSIHERLSRASEVLAVIDRRRTETGDDSIGAAIERRVLDRELRELEDACKIDGVQAAESSVPASDIDSHVGVPVKRGARRRHFS